VSVKLRSEAIALAPKDSLRAGALTVKYTADDLSRSTVATLARGAAIAWGEAQAALGDAATRVVGRLPIIVNERRWVQRLEPRHIDFGLQGVPTRGRTFLAPIGDQEVATELLDLLGTVASIDEPAGLKAWFGDWIPLVNVTPQRWSDAAIDLATSNTSVARDCFGGSTMRCESALGLVEAKDPLRDWYSDEDLRVLVSTFARQAQYTNEELDKCLSGNSPATCLAIARTRPVPRPLNGDSRRTVLGLALELGGTKAYDRLISAKGTALEILSVTAGVPADSLMAEWRRRVLAAAPARVKPELLEASAMVAWTLLFAFGATRRRP
jgi:hypothetical protein